MHYIIMRSWYEFLVCNKQVSNNILGSRFKSLHLHVHFLTKTLNQCFGVNYIAEAEKIS